MKLTKVIIAATCKTDGEGIFSCECGEAEERRVIPASTDYHDYVYNRTEGSYKIYVCSMCNDTKVELVEGTNHVHDYAIDTDSTVAATCTKEGTTVKVCQNADDGNCDAVVVTETVPMIDHESTTASGKGYVITKPVKCTTDGEERVTCKYCGKQFYRTISAHNYNSGVVTLAATCTEAGTKLLTCKDCGATTTEEIEALDHNFGVAFELVSATCEKTGISEKVCKRCGDEEKTILKALGHTPKAGTSVAWLDEDGKDVTTTATANGKANTCYYTKATKYECAHHTSSDETNRCNDADGVIYEIVKTATGHIIDESKTVREGYATLKATKVAGETDVYEYIEGNYELEDGKVKLTKTGTVDCTHEKIKMFTCATCGKPQTVVTSPATKHTGAVETYSVTCKTKGYTLTSCTKCNKIVKEENEDDEYLDHDFVIIEATCENNARIECSMCKVSGTITGGVAATDTLDNKGFKAFYDALTPTQKATATKKATEHNIVAIVDGKGKCANIWCDYEDNLVPGATLDGDKEEDSTKIKVEAPTSTVATAEKLLGKDLTTFQNGTITVSTKGETGTVSGTLKYVENFTAFNEANPSEQEGNYLVLYFPEAISGTAVTCELKGTGSSGKGPVAVDKADGLIILKIANKDQTIEIKSGKEIITLSLTGLTLLAK